MKIVLASDSYKGSLSSIQVNNIVAQQAQKVFGKCDKWPMEGKELWQRF